MLKRIRLKNFRRFPFLELNFDQELNIIEGENNAGKTSLFMGIEYALFGNVQGFKTQASLAHPGSNAVGVELVYTGINGLEYKIQRMHDVTNYGSKAPKSAKGHFTLKEIDGEEEKYLISSDFEKNSEEMLQLKILETVGLTRRLFDIAVNVKQGEISQILQGAPELDIVLGVSASKSAEKVVRKVALGYEKETSQYNALNASVNALQKERIELVKQNVGLETQKSQLVKSFNKLEKQKENITKIEEYHSNLSDNFDDAYETGEDWENSIKNYKTLSSEYSNVIEEIGSIDEIDTEIKSLNAIIDEKDGTADDFDSEIITLETTATDLNKKIGNLEGKIIRRKSQSMDKNPVCEYCGAKIDRSNIDFEQLKKELKEWEKEQSSVQNELTKINKKLQEIKNSKNIRDKEISNKRTQIVKLEGHKDRVETSLSKMNDIVTKIDNIKQEFVESFQNLTNSKIQYDKDIEEWINENQSDEVLQNNLNLVKWEFKQEETIKISELEVDGEIITKFQDLTNWNDEIDRIRDFVIGIKASFQEQINGEKRRLADLENLIKSISPRIKSISKEITTLEAELKILERKKEAAKKLRTLSKGFKKLSEQLRSRSAIELAIKTLEFHSILSQSDEYSSLKIDPKNYTVLLEPHDIPDQEVPAYSFQGGGHKLLLGLAYKLAISNIVHKPTFLLLDEPTYGLDPENKLTLFKNLNNIASSVQINLITHQRSDLSLSGQIIKVERDGTKSTLEVVN